MERLAARFYLSATSRFGRGTTVWRLPNKRLKLAGVIVFKGGRCVVAPASSVYRSAVDAPAGLNARSLSAIR